MVSHKQTKIKNSQSLYFQKIDVITLTQSSLCSCDQAVILDRASVFVSVCLGVFSTKAVISELSNHKSKWSSHKAGLVATNFLLLRARQVL